METAIYAGDIAGIVRNIENAFDPVVSGDHPEINHIKEIYRTHGALAAQMTGSGSVVFAVMPDMESAEKAAEELKMTYGDVNIVFPV